MLQKELRDAVNQLLSLEFSGDIPSPHLVMLPSRDPACRAADKTAAGRREKVGVASLHH